MTQRRAVLRAILVALAVLAADQVTKALVRGSIVFDGPPRDLPGVWHDPSHMHA